MGALVVFLLIGYFIPTVVAMMRGHKDAPAIALINIFLGWTVVAWFATLVWSLADPGGRGANQTVVITNENNSARTPETSLISAGDLENARLASPALGASLLLSRTNSVNDIAFWDSLKDKNDPDSLEEYLTRFPNGDFSKLALTRLERGGRPWAVVSTAIAANEATLDTCEKCGSMLDLESQFCSDCGHAVSMNR